MKRQTIPLAVRYAVLCNQADSAQVDKINCGGGSLKSRYAKVLALARCRMTGEKLIEHGCEFDHRNPKFFGGSDDPDNLQALIPKAHRRKTDSDIAAIAKTNRIIRKAEGTWRPNKKKIQSRNTLSQDYRKAVRERMEK